MRSEIFAEGSGGTSELPAGRPARKRGALAPWSQPCSQLVQAAQGGLRAGSLAADVGPDPACRRPCRPAALEFHLPSEPGVAGSVRRQPGCHDWGCWCRAGRDSRAAHTLQGTGRPKTGHGPAPDLQAAAAATPGRCLFLLLPPTPRCRPSDDKDVTWPYSPQSVKQVPHLSITGAPGN